MRSWILVCVLAFGCGGSSRLTRGDFEIAWSRYEMKTASHRGHEVGLRVPTADAVPVTMTRDQWLADHVGIDSLERRESVLSIPPRLTLAPRTITSFTVPAGAVQSIEHTGRATRAYWTINRPTGSDGSVSSKLILVAERPGVSRLDLVTSIGETRSIEVVVK